MAAYADPRRTGRWLLDAAALAVLLTAIAVALVIPSVPLVGSGVDTSTSGSGAGYPFRGGFAASKLNQPISPCTDEDPSTDCPLPPVDSRYPERVAIAGLGLALALTIAGSTRLVTRRSELSRTKGGAQV